MCGIAGFSLNNASKINARELSHALLSSIESRGLMSSGAAWPTPGEEGGVSVYKDAVRGSNLPLKEMPRNTKTVILHTRYATKGNPSDNTNNHPVWSPHATVALVHNGVIWNDMSLRFGTLREIDNTGLMPEVDTACIPALLEAKGLEGLGELGGDAAIAWLETSDPHTLNLARLEHSPLSYTNLEDGSFVFASTPALLRQALDSLNLIYGQVFNMGERDMYTLRGGVIMQYIETPEPVGYGRGLASSTRNATAGGTGSSTGSKYYGIGSTFGQKAIEGAKPNYAGGTNSALFGTGETETEVIDVAAATEEELEQRAMAMLEAEVDRIAKEENGRVIYSMPFQHPEVDEGEENWKVLPEFYTIDADGNMDTYGDLDELEEKLLYLAGRAGEEVPFGEGRVKWVNYFSDIGSFGFDGESIISWLDEPAELSVLAQVEEANDIEYIRDGVSILAGMKGA